MGNFIVWGVCALVVATSAQRVPQGKPPSGGQGQQYVWDILKPPVTDMRELLNILQNAQPGVTYPNFSEIPQTQFKCSKPGFYADTEAKCQLFHWCGLNGEQNDYLCVASTLFNQITLTCDYFFNVDCEGYAQYSDFANSRLFTDQPLFDTPPADYVPPHLRGGNQGQGAQ